MLELTVDNLPCVAITPELSAQLAAIGEDVHALNYLRWPAGASNYGEAVILMHSDDATTLATGDRSRTVALRFVDDTQTQPNDGIIAPTDMYQIEHRKVHSLSINGVTTSLVAVKLVDSRYFWTGIVVDAAYNMTLNSDRSKTYDQSETGGSAYTISQIVSALLSTLGISGSTTVASISGTTYDQLINGERACDALDRILASAGMVFYSYPSITNGSGFVIASPSANNSNVAKTSDKFLADRIAGDNITTAGDTDGKAWLNATMPSSVKVFFPREMPSSASDSEASSNPPVMRQFYSVTSTAGKPSGVTGRSGYVQILYDTLWARGPIGSETNASALSSRADVIAASFYARFSANRTMCRLKGWAALGPVPGEIIWRLTESGPFTDVNTAGNWGIYGGDVDVVDGFNRKRVVGLGGLQTFKGFDGSLFLMGGNGNQAISGLVTGNASGNGKYTGKSFTDVTTDVSASGNLAESDFGTLAGSNDCLILNPPELNSSTTGHDVTATANTDRFAIYFTGRLASVNSDGTKVIHAMLFWVGCDACDCTDQTLDGGSP